MSSQRFIGFTIAMLICFANYTVLVRVCKNNLDYYIIGDKECYDNPDTKLNVTEILRYRWNCTAEEYNITTDDGYQILVIRAYQNISNPIPIILGHGIIMNTLGFLSLYTHSLAYHIIKSGRQIFFVNYRGTRYSLGHTGNITEHDYDYWKFSFHEMAIYDTPKILELVKNMTNRKSIMISYSLSSTATLAYATLNPEDTSSKLIGIITMGTAVFFQNSTSSLKFFAKISPTLAFGLKLIYNGKLFPRDEMMPVLKFAAQGPLQYLTLMAGFSAIVGTDPASIAPEYFPVVVLNTPDCLGQNVALHYAQVFNTGKFRQFDYGAAENTVKYGAAEPPEYDLSKISVPVAQILGKGDILTTVEDALRVASQLNSKISCGVTVLKYEKWTHDDFVDSKYQEKYLVPEVLKHIESMESGRC